MVTHSAVVYGVPRNYEDRGELYQVSTLWIYKMYGHQLYLDVTTYIESGIH